MLVVIWTMFVLATASWVVEFVILVDKVKSSVKVKECVITAGDVVDAIVRINVSQDTGHVSL